MQTFRLFVSSPGDVMVERRRVENVVSRLNGEFAGVARLETVRWETEHYQAHSTFQAQIVRSVDCDLVIGILKWRLGTELPPEFGETLADGRPYPSGTAYEILTAIEKRQKGEELPDVYVFRFAASSPTIAVEDPNRDRIERDWQVLKGFFQDWFVTERGHFKAAFNPYGSEDDFEAQLETLLRKWLADKAAGGRVIRWPIAVKGSPFRGLAAFGAKHAPVFFGRSDDITRAAELWREAGGRGSPFLLVVGASGAGKSSLARAGLVPRITTPGVVRQVDAWRVAVMRPSDDPAGPLAALAAALMQDENALPKDEEGRGPALPEIAQGDSKTPAELAAVLRAGGAAAVRPILNALARVGATDSERERYQRDLRCDLVLLLDQFEELFADQVSAAERSLVLDLLAAMVETGRIWIAVTLRADFYARMLVEPALKALKEKGATYDLAPPGPHELAEIVRAPAEAAGLVFEADPATGQRLDTRLLRDADRPDMLPLVQLALARLYEGREIADGETRLPLKVYASLGGLTGIIDEAGETALGSLGEAEKARLPRLLRQLAVSAEDQEVAGQGVLTIRAVPLSQAAPDEATRNLVHALVAARLLTTSGVEADAQVRLAHQRVLDDWARARTIVVESADFYRIRADIEDGRRRWEAGKRRGELLLARGLPLAEAENIVSKYGDELAPETLAYVRASRARANRAQIIGFAAAAVFFLLAIGAGFAAKVASDQRAAAEEARARAEQEKQRADQNFNAAKRTVDRLIFDLAGGLRTVSGVKVESIRSILGAVQETIDQLAQNTPGDRGLLRSRAAMYANFVDTYLAAGDLKSATTAATQGLEVVRKLAADSPDDANAQRDIAVILTKLGDVKLQAGDLSGALVAFQEAVDISRKFAAQDKGLQGQLDIALTISRIGNAKLQAGDQAGALVAYQESLDVARKLAAANPDDAQIQRYVAVSLHSVGEVRLQSGDRLGAVAAFDESLAILRKLSAQNPADGQLERDISISLFKVGDVKLLAGDAAGALAAYQEALAIARRLAAQDPGSAMAQRDVQSSLNRLGDIKLKTGDAAAALVLYQEGLDIARKLAAQDEGNVQAQRDVSVCLNKIGDAKAQAGDKEGALKDFRESLEISRKLAAQDPSNLKALRDVAVSLNRLGDAQIRADDLAGAVATFRESLDIARKLAVQDPDNAEAQRDLSIGLNKFGDALLRSDDREGALAAFRESVGISRKLVAIDPGSTQAQTDLVIALFRLTTAATEVDEVRTILTEVLSILEALDRDNRLIGEQKRWLEVVRNAVSKLPAP